MTDPERIAKLEEKISSLDRRVDDIMQELSEARNRSERSALDGAELKTQLASLIKALQDHQDWHSNQKTHNFSWAQAVMALGMLALAFMEFVRG